MKKTLIIGPIFQSASGPTGQGGSLFTQLSNVGHNVVKASHIRNKYFRFIHIVLFFFKNAKSANIILLQSFGLLAFFIEDLISLLAFYFKIPIVFTLHGGAFLEFYHKHPQWVRNVLNRVTLITSPSHYLSESLGNVGIPVLHLPNAIDLSRFNCRPNVVFPHSLLWVRAFNDIYHPELAIECVNSLRIIYPDIHLTMIGPDQGTLSKCKSLITYLGLNNYISILGYVANSDLSKYYSTHAVYINTTRYESFGVALIEAGASGIPIVSTNVGEIPYIWQDKKNILLSERCPKSFAAQVATLFDKDSLADSISAAAKENIQQYDWTQVLPKWEEFIEKYSKK